jgi:hypothetical protein
MFFPERLYLSTRPQWCNIQAVSNVRSDHHNTLKRDSKLKLLYLSNVAEELHFVVTFVNFRELKKNP